jgi:hypothetical protein
MVDQVTLHIKGGLATFGVAGIELKPWFTRSRVLIPWANVMFVSPIPAVRRNGSEWHTWQGENITPDVLRSSLRFFCLQVALNARADLWASAGFLTFVWLVTSVWIKPLYGADDKPHPTNGVITLDLRQRWLRNNGGSLLSALDIIERFSKFDLIVSFD